MQCASIPQPLTTIGLMSGTSLDGVDAAILVTDGVQVQAHGPSLTLPYTPELRATLRTLLDQAPHLAENDPAILAATHALTLHHAQAVQALCQKASITAPDLIGFHGQTVLHQPGRTWQIGDGPALSALTQTPVVHDFRTADVLAGGQGAPLVPLYHAALLHNHAGPLAILNLGGVGNLTFVGSDNTLLACDTGPGNALLDDWTHQHTGKLYDQNGALALKGTVQAAPLARLLDNPYFSLPLPKSLDRLSFHAGLAYLQGLSPENGAATLTAFTAHAVAKTAQALPETPRAWFVCGGGRLNPALMAALRHALTGHVCTVDEELGWNGDALEAECFGFLAARSIRGLPLSLPGTTGVPAPTTGGRFSCSGLPAYRIKACASLLA